MFCLRSWIPILFFLYVCNLLLTAFCNDAKLSLTRTNRTNASPIYLILFISATYSLNRPCVYCSLLLAILVLALFDFGDAWFEPHYLSSASKSGTSSQTNTTTTHGTNGTAEGVETAAAAEILADTVSLFASAVNATASAAASMAVEGLKSRVGLAAPSSPSSGGWAEGARSVVRQREWRVPCLDVLVRL